ncbi:flagellar protein FlhE [Salinisphaera sp. Q1T1-3]|uniref:flagellar protein FlhE n=1 Tax=Salinisphaera sp. Q1T1-3 TaxID=2321229 RepID=UPI000E7194FF|nr:flagellar protein FlhE [Salinisphaera sp. Q1T1-3]RJS95178.1 flagellar protein FlhE [Salinisphaera sp. Q1T1-3]
MSRLAAWQVAVATIGLAAPVAATAAGSWVAEAALPTLRYHGQRYVSPVLKPRPTTPIAGDGIHRVHWTYGYDRPGPRLSARLCAAGRCIDASKARGTSEAFAGLAVATPFRLVLAAPGTGPISPVLRAGHIQLVVDFQ